MNELEIIKQQLPVLEIKDYEKIKKAVEKDVEKYKNYIVTQESLADDTKLRAELNNKAKAINSKRLEIQKQVEEPIKTFKSKCDDLKALYEEASTLIDGQIKTFETKDKEEKKNKIAEIFKEKNKELETIVDLEMIFEDSWLNKGSWDDKGNFKSEKEMDDKLSKISEDLKAIKNLKTEHELSLTNQYLKEFDLGKIIIENNRLNELKANTKKVEEKQEEIKQEKVEEMMAAEVVIEEDDPIKQYTLSIKGELSKIKALRKFMELNNIEFKLEEK